MGNLVFANKKVHEKGWPLKETESCFPPNSQWAGHPATQGGTIGCPL
jgi:hypothetical protein